MAHNQDAPIRRSVRRTSPSVAVELKEVAPPPVAPWGASWGGRRLNEHILRSEGFGGHASAYSLFEEMEDKDAHLFSVLQTRKLGLLARSTTVEPSGDGPEDRARAQWVAEVLEGLAGRQTALLHALDALGKGMSVLEIVWAFDAEGRIVPRALKPRSASRLTWRGAEGWRLIDPEGDPLGAGRPVPPRKFIVALVGADDARPHGKGLCEKVYWHWWFKKQNIKFWLIYNEKFGCPTVVARHGVGLSDAERERLLDVIDAIQTDAGVTVPEGITLELLEAHRSGSGETYRTLAQWCNDEISRAVLGQTLTSSEGDRSGSLALGRVHEAVRSDYMRADAGWLMDVVNTQLVRPLVDLNFGLNVPAPRWRIDVSAELDLEQEVNVDGQLLKMGVPLPLRYFYEKYGRPAPSDAERCLQNDDANMYQYHLQFGVLTVNEVRSRLGLPPVEWGNRPPSPVETRQPPSGPVASTGEDPPEEIDDLESEREEETSDDDL